MIMAALLATVMLVPSKFSPAPSATAKVCVLDWTDHSNGVVSVSYTNIYGEGSYGLEESSTFKCSEMIGGSSSWFFANVSSSIINNQSGDLIIITTLPFFAQGAISDSQRFATSSISLSSPELGNPLNPNQPPVSLSDTAEGQSPTPNAYYNAKTLDFANVVGPILVPGMSSIDVSGTCYGHAHL